MLDNLRFDDQVVVITGAGSGLGRAYALLFAARGAKVVVNDLGGGINGDGSPKKNAADAVVAEIKNAGGVAIPDYNNVIDGFKIVEAAVKAFGTVHVLINNAGILRDVSFRNMTARDWNLIQDVHMMGTYRTTRAAWDVMARQKYGRIVCTASAAGIYGSFGQVNYAAAKAAIIGFVNSLAKEGAEHNIKVNTLAPAAASRLTQTVMTPDLLEKLGPEWVAPIVCFLAHKDMTETGSIFDIGAGCVMRFRLQRATGFEMGGLRQPRDILSSWPQIMDAKSTPSVQSQSEVRLSRGKPAVVVSVGKSYNSKIAQQLAASGAHVVVNGTSMDAVQSIVQHVRHSGGTASADSTPPDRAEELARNVIDKLGSIHTLVLTVSSTSADHHTILDDSNWDGRYHEHLTSVYKILKAFWPILVKQKYGRVIILDSTSNISGRPNESAISSAAMGATGLARTLAREGERYGIMVNFISSQEAQSSSELSASLVTLLSSDSLKDRVTNNIFSVQGTNIALNRWQRSQGHSYPVDKPLSIEEVAEKWDEITSFQQHEYPNDSQQGMAKLLHNVGLAKAYQPKQLQAKQAESGSKL